MNRMIFEKTGKAVWISHLDLMRLFQRAFKRAGLPLTHTQGFNPRPSVSIALPLSVGVESKCELLDFQLENAQICFNEMKDALNKNLIAGVHVCEIYDTGRKIRDLNLLHCIVTLEYDNGVAPSSVDAIKSLFTQESLIVPKKTKNGIQQQDIIPMIRRLNVNQPCDNTIELDALVCCQNPALNPAQLALAVELHLPQYKADFFKCRRVEIYDNSETIFR